MNTVHDEQKYLEAILAMHLAKLHTQLIEFAAMCWFATMIVAIIVAMALRG